MERTLPFPCAYALKAALHITFDVLDQMALMSRTTFEKLMRDIKKRSKESLVVERALSHIVSSIDAGNVVMFGPAFYVACSLFKDEKPPQLARGTCLVRSVFVTPGRLIFRPPQVHFENRILSEFNAEFAIRVSFRDDNLDKLSFSLNLHSSLDAILNAVVARFLHDGLQVGTREFKFLAPSTCQLRDHGRELLKPTYVVTAIASDSTTRQSAKVSPLSTCKKKPVSFSEHAAFSRGGASASGAMVSMEIEINIANRTTDTVAVLTLTKTQLAFRGQLPAATSGCQHQVTDVRDGLCVVGLAVS
ncbi:hypothetical protein HPB51_001842 [Rhipicephalus microplus]|uniref:RNA-dependent RNA polymerase n=1 Tax=Rhipicephalus microplus TaxID=6941 RepID=A0A9J6D918_RHIMP|nr:hypothetical protein HPB51_001842 [Rhipicephalus microplus]